MIKGETIVFWKLHNAPVRFQGEIFYKDQPVRACKVIAVKAITNPPLIIRRLFIQTAAFLSPDIHYSRLRLRLSDLVMRKRNSSENRILLQSYKVIQKHEAFF